MQIAVLFNPGAGRGRGESVAADLDHVLTAAGHRVHRRPVGPVLSAATAAPRAVSLSYDPVAARDPAAVKAPPPARPIPKIPGAEPRPLAEAELVIIVGGDGTLHHALNDIAQRRTTVYHAPLGTENLFARQFGMTAEPRAVVQAVQNWRLRDVDLGLANGRRFAIMGSVGADASVIRRLAASRDGAISHRSYLRPVMSELFHPCMPTFTLTVDGQDMVVARRGMVVVANSRQYALRIDPIPRADPCDGQLDVVFLPARTGLGLLARVLLARLRLPSRGVLRARGRRIEITAEHPGGCSQFDGETGPEAESGRLQLNLEIEPVSLRVLLGRTGI